MIFIEFEKCNVYIATMGEKSEHKAIELVNSLREEGFLSSMTWWEEDSKLR